jgi:hypothetical protein
MVRLSLFKSASCLYFGPHFPALGVGKIAPNVPEIGQFSIRDASQERRDPAEFPVLSLFDRERGSRDGFAPACLLRHLVRVSGVR